eukprot:scaffold96072_cov33-Attheya_sp.AAC.1
MRPELEPQEEAASNEPIDFKIHLIDLAKNCPRVQNVKRQRESRETESRKKPATHFLSLGHVSVCSSLGLCQSWRYCEGKI